MTLLGALVVLLHLRRRNLDFLHTYIHTYKSPGTLGDSLITLRFAMDPRHYFKI